MPASRAGGRARRIPGVGASAYAGLVAALITHALLDDLNPQQRAAVLHEGGPLLIVFLVFAFRQGEKAKPSGRNPDAGVMDAKDLSRGL